MKHLQEVAGRQDFINVTLIPYLHHVRLYGPKKAFLFQKRSFLVNRPTMSNLYFRRCSICSISTLTCHLWILGQTTEHSNTLPIAYSIIHFVSVEPPKNTMRLFVDLGRI